VTLLAASDFIQNGGQIASWHFIQFKIAVHQQLHFFMLDM